MSGEADIDLYGVLGVPRDATAREIRRAYRRLARQQHPDLNPHPDGPRRFATLTKAYEILHDPAQRARYDDTLSPSPTATSWRRTAPRSPAQPAPTDGLAIWWGVLELSPHEAAHLLHRPLVLRDPRGGTIVLPARTSHGEQITLLRDGHPAVLTVRMPGKS